MSKILPPMAPLPPVDAWTGISTQDWAAFADMWNILALAYLGLSERDFAVNNLSSTNVVNFLVSYMEVAAARKDIPVSLHAHSLRRNVFLLVHRIFLRCSHTHAKMMSWTFLGDLSRVYRGSEDLEILLEKVWEIRGSQIESSLKPLKQSLITNLDSISGTGSVLADFPFSHRLLPLVDALPAVGAYLIAGSDFLDTVAASYQGCSAQLRPKLLALIFLSLCALMQGLKPNHSMLFDHLYGLRDSANEPQNTSQQTLLADLVTDTPLITQMTKRINGSDAARARTLTTSLSKFRRPHSSRPHRHRHVDKGKSKDVAVASSAEYGHDAFHTVHVHRMSLVTQVQDLFPDLGSAFVARLLDEYGDSVEQVTAHLLDNSLPEHLDSADRSATLPPMHTSNPDLVPNLAPRSTPPPSPPPARSAIPARRNIHDDDELDRLAVSTSRLHFGRRTQPSTADSMLDGRSTNKAAILSALAAFDADDDERDDTYDVADVGGTVDTTSGAGVDAAATAAENDEALFVAWSMSPAVFERDSATRRSPARQALRSETGLTDEAIEGWAVMIRRDPRRLKRLEARFERFTGQQTELSGSAWRADSATEDSEASGPEGARGGFRGGRGRGRGGARGASVAGETGEKGTHVARQRKEASKGSRANHNRRDQRAKKMARGGFAG